MYVCILDINSGTPSTTKPNITAESNLPNSKRMLNLRVGKVFKNINYYKKTKIHFLMNISTNILYFFRMKN